MIEKSDVVYVADVTNCFNSFEPYCHSTKLPDFNTIKTTKIHIPHAKYCPYTK